MTTNVYEIITARFVESLNNGVLPWSKGFDNGRGPRSVGTGKEYRGVNWLLLSMIGGDDWFVTFNQAKALGGSVRKGAKGIPVTFWKRTERETKAESGETELKRSFLLRYYTVFKLSDTENVKFTRPPVVTRDNPPIAECERVASLALEGFGINIEYAGNQPCFIPALNTIQLPPRERWHNSARFYKTFFHEIGHALMKVTGDEPSAKFGTDPYAKEELTAEIFATFALSFCGVELTPELFDNSTAYLQSWAKRFQNDPKLIISAAGKAQKRLDALLGAAESEAEE